MGRSALITGSTSGIGLGIAKVLAAQGINVAMTGLGSAAELETAIESVQVVATGQTVFIPADMRRPDDIANLVAETANTFGSLDILVNNAGIQHVAAIQDFPAQKWDDIIAVNLSASFHTIRYSVPHMLTAGEGRIINIASAHALAASPFKSAYVAAKHGIAGLTKTVALELAQSNITVNAVAPGYVKTPLVDAQVADTARVRGVSEDEVVADIMLAAQPTGKMISIDQVASLVLYLCSADAAAITGSILPIDGGWTAK